MSDKFNMPPAPASFEERGGWLVVRLAADLSLTHNQAAGIVGNLGYESMGFKTLQELKPTVSGSRGGYGWAQWTGPRRRAFEKWATENNLKPSSDAANYGFLIVELRGSYRAAVREVAKMTTLEDAVFSVGQTYERPGGTTPDHLPGFSGRLQYAERALAGSVATPVLPTRPAVDRIKAIQLVLAEGGEYTAAIDGDFGPKSEAALSILVNQRKGERA